MLARLSINTGLQLGARGLEFACGIIVSAWLARQWGSTVFGQIGFISGMAGLFAFLFDFGLSSLLLRQVSRERQRAVHLVANAIVAALPLTLLGAAVVVGVGVLVGAPSYLWGLTLASLQAGFTALAALLRSAFYAYERMEFETAATVVDRLCWLGAGIWLATQPPNLVLMFALLAGCKLVNLLLCAFFFMRHIAPKCEMVAFGSGEQLDLVKRSLPFGLNMAFSTVYISVDIVMLEAFVGGEEVGFYRAAAMLIVPLATIAIALNNALFPRMAVLARESPEASARHVELSVRLLMLAAMPLGLFVALYAGQIVDLLFGPAYRPAVPMLQLLAVVIPLRFLNNTLAVALTAHDHQRWRTISAGAAATFNVAANAVAISRWHGLGACITTLATDLLIVVMLWSRLRQVVGPQAIQGFAAAQGAGLAALVLLPVFIHGVPLLPAAGILALAYPVLLVATDTLSLGEVRKLLSRPA